LSEAKIAIIDNSIYPEIYKPVEHWTSFMPGADWVSFYAPDGKLPDPDDFSHFLFTGSEASILERAAWVDPEVELAQAAHERGKYLLGSCYGHQLLAFALAGPDHVGRAPEPEIGWIDVDILADSPLLGPPRKAFTFSVHFDEVRSLPGSSFIILAASDRCSIQAFRSRDGRVWGFQIHPEIQEPEARRLLADFKDVFPAFRDLYEKALASPARDSGLIHTIVDGFLKLPV
jgi:GMP synthase-like glutamine amidotransferase